MHWDHVIRNGKLVSSDTTVEGNIYIKDGKIAAVSREPLEGTADEITDATGYHVFPGFIDAHVHSRDPGATHKEDFFHSTRAAAAGGITTIFEMPNTNPPVDCVDNFYRQADHLQKRAYVDFALWAICLGKLNLRELQSLSDAGVIGFKFFWGYAINRKTYQLVYNYRPGMDDILPPPDEGQVFNMFQEVAKTGQRLAIHAENHELIQHLTDRVKATGRTDYEALLSARPNVVETTAIQTAIALARETGARLHILHVSTKEGVDLIRDAQREGLPVTAETCPHYLFLSKEDFARVGGEMKVYPLVKREEDQLRLWQGIREGTISYVGSDHAPHTEEEKDGDLWTIPAGMCGVETIGPLMIDAVRKNKITEQQLAALLSENPAKLFGIYPQKGSLQIGTDADLTIVDFSRTHEIRRERLHSKSKVTAYHGFRLQGAPVATIVRGKTVMKDGVIIGEPCGTIVKPSSSE